MNKIGFNVLAWSAAVDDSLLPILERLKKIGYDGVECFIGGQDPSAFRRFGQQAKELGLETTAVCTLGVHENPIDPSAAVRNKALDRIKWIVDAAHSMNASVLCGPFHSAHGFFPGHEPLEQEYEYAAEVLHPAGEHASQAGIVLGLEAVNRFECYLANTMKQMRHLLDHVGHPNVQAMYDTHHAHLEEKSIAAPLELIFPSLAHVHISENDRGTPGSGTVRWDETFSVLSQLNYQGWYTIEAFSRNDPDFANAINVWREYDSPWDIAEKGYALIKNMCEKHRVPERENS